MKSDKSIVLGEETNPLLKEEAACEDNSFLETTRRIVVSDDLPVISHEIRGRRLENPPDERQIVPAVNRKQKWRTVRTPYVVVGAGASLILVAAIVMLVFRPSTHSNTGVQAPEQAAAPVNRVSNEANELRRIEEDAKQVMRRISRDNRPYSFSEKSLQDINARTLELKRSPHLSESIRQLQNKGEPIASRAAKEGLQPSLVILLALALTNGGESGDSVKAASNALPLLASLNKTFGSNEGDSCLILIAAFHEGPGTRRSHPLLKRINKVVTNPLTERNVWYLDEQNALAGNALSLVIDTIAFGVITRSPRQFGLENEPLNF